MPFDFREPHGHGPHTHGPHSYGHTQPTVHSCCRHVPPPAPRHSVCHTHTVYVTPPPPPRPPRPRYYSPSYTTGTVLATGVAVAAGQVIGQAVAQSVVQNNMNNTYANNGYPNNTYGTARSMVPGNYPKFCGNCGATTTGARMCEYCGGYLY